MGHGCAGDLQLDETGSLESRNVSVWVDEISTRKVNLTLNHFSLCRSRFSEAFEFMIIVEEGKAE